MAKNTTVKYKSKLRKSSPRKKWVPKYEVKRDNVDELIAVRDAYYEAIGFEFDSKRRTEKDVIFRVAYAEAMSKYFKITAIAKALEKDHTSIVHYMKQCLLYEGYYDFYKALRETATCIYHLEVGKTSLGMQLKENIKQYVEALEA